MNTPQPMNMRDGTVVSEKMEPVVPSLVCRDVKTTKRRFSPSNGSFFDTTGAEIRIPISGNFVLDNKNVNLNFKLKTLLASVLDFSPIGLFSQIRVEAGTGSSIVLESIDDPAVWANFLYQYTWTHEDMAIQSAKQRSCANQPGPSRGTITAAAGPPIIVGQTTQGAGVLDKQGESLAISTDIDIALDLSTFMGIFSASSGLPLYDTAGVTIVLTLNNVANAVFAASAANTITLSNIYVTASCLEGGESYEKKLKEMKNSGNKEISIMYNTCRRYVQAQSSSTSSVVGTYLINERSKSCLGFLAIARDTNNVNKSDTYSNSNSAFPGISRYEYNIAGMAYPVAGITTLAEQADEAYDLFSQLSRRHDSGGLLSRPQIATDSITDAASHTLSTRSATGPSQVLAINLSKCGANEEYWGKGMNLSNSNLTSYLQATYVPWVLQTINIYSVYQMKLHIDALGNMTTEF